MGAQEVHAVADVAVPETTHDAASDRVFTVSAVDPGTGARRGRLRTAHGVVETPAFMPVGTSAAVKGLDPDDLVAVGAHIILANTYHLWLRPGHRVIADLGGLHRFMGWSRPILTDSGGFQVYSLAALRRVSDEGVSFRSHLDGSLRHLTPEGAIEIQDALGADIVMAFDECLAYPATEAEAAEALRRTAAWARRCAEVRRSRPSLLFGIVQGGFSRPLRDRAVAESVAVGFDGYAMGGLSVGEPKDEMLRVIDHVAPRLPASRPRYLMGVGTPADLVDGVARGLDLFDCVMPTRHARTGWLFTSEGRVSIKHARYTTDERPLDPACGCSTCRRFSRAYLRHLFQSNDPLAVRLHTIHNLTFYLDLMAEMRRAIEDGRFGEWKARAETAAWRRADGPVQGEEMSA
ncbi:MAG TPA: tRNA guanosine(34) transglycosylase Tgt [Nitrospiria bacterium]|nr:tRNA guanosine(34) transglycosylase Tgt [Nitrospiria bacterium]